MSVENHRHCQATVLGATGDPHGHGLTWHEIANLDVPNISELNRHWLSFFNSNDNMTQDLAGILKLIENLTEKVFELSNREIPDTSPLPGDLISVDNGGRTVNVKNSIPNGYQGVVGIEGSGSNRKLVACPVSPAPSQGDLIQIGNGNVSVKNDIEDGYEGVVGIVGSGADRRLSEYSVRIENEDDEGEVIATLHVGDKTFPIRGKKAAVQPDPPEEEPRYVITEDKVWDIVLSGGENDGEPLDYNDDQEPEPRYVVTENGHEFDIGVSGYGDSVLLNYNED